MGLQYRQVSALALVAAILGHADVADAQGISEETEIAVGTPERSSSADDVAHNRTAQADIAAGSGNALIDEVVVTAQKREQRLQDVPISVSVVSGEDLDRSAILSLSDLSETQPSLHVSPGLGSDRLHIRGLGSGENASFEQSVATFVDGVYRSRARATRVALFDVERVEVLKGPQTTYFGANAIAGALNITTRAPGDEFSGHTLALYSPSDGEYNAEASVGGPVTDTLGLRFAGRMNGMDGYVDNSQDGSEGPSADDKQARLSFDWKPTSSISIAGRVDAAQLDQKGIHSKEVTGCPPASGNPATGLCARALTLSGGSVDTTLDYRSDAYPSALEMDLVEAVIAPTIEIGDHTLVMTTAYGRQESTTNYDVIPFAGPSPIGTPNNFPFLLDEEYEQVSQEIRFQSPTGGRVEYMMGAYFEDNRLEMDTRAGYFFVPFAGLLPGFVPAVVPSPLTPIGSNADFEQDTETLSGFGTITVRITDPLRVTAGMRYSSVRKEADRISFMTITDATLENQTAIPDAYQAGMSRVVGSTIDNFTDPTRTDTKFMPSANIQYDISDNATAYFSYARGFKAGGFNHVGATDFDPETVDSVELGVKSTLFDGRATANVAVFQGWYKDLQEATVVVLPTGLTTSQVRNAAKSRVRGVEFDGGWRVTNGFTLSTSVAYLDSIYSEYTDAPCTNLQISALPRGALCSQDLSGRSRSYAPKWKTNVAANLVLPVSARLNFELGGSVSWSSEYYQQSTLDPLLIEPSLTRLDLRAAIGAPDGRWQLSVIGKNVTDEYAGHSRAVIPTTAETTSITPDRPRSVVLQISSKW